MSEDFTKTAEIQEEVIRAHAQIERLNTLVEELGAMFDDLEQQTNQQIPAWWKAHRPLAKIREELEGWLPPRILKLAQDKLQRGPYSQERQVRPKQRPNQLDWAMPPYRNSSFTAERGKSRCADCGCSGSPSPPG